VPVEGVWFYFLFDFGVWLGVSILVPSTWKWASSGIQDTVYHLQLHGGDNEGAAPNLGIRIVKDQININLCGNNDVNSSFICSDYNIGEVAIGEWMDIVIHSQLSYGSHPNPQGSLDVWRNQIQMLHIQHVLTSYNETNPPYLKLGTYNIDWKENIPTGYTWSSTLYKAIRVGDAIFQL
jgi:hypothetical protein